MRIADILLVDDDIAVCRIVQRMLTELPYKVQMSQSVADALRAIEDKPFDVYVLDYKLPDGSGLDVAERIRSKWGPAPIILISGYDKSAVALKAERFLINDILEKPFSREKVCMAVKKAIDSLAVSSPEPTTDQTRDARHADFISRRLAKIKRLWGRLK
jgi:two-component system, NtrC family, response regulator HydG